MKKAISIAAALFVVASTAYFVLGDDGKIGHFTSEEGKERFRRAYDEAMALLPEPEASKDIETGYGTVRVYYFTKEENRYKEPILLLPGRSASTPMWEANLGGLLEERPVYILDLLGEPGMSVQTREIKNQVEQAEWLSQVIADLDLTRVHIVGVSFGGWTAMNLVKYHPERVASVSLLDPVFVFAPISWKVVVLSIPATVPIVPKPIREKMLSYISGGAKADESEPVAKMIEAGMANYKGKLPAPVQFSHEDLRSIERPVLALMAEKSVMHDSQKAVETGKKYVRDIDIVSWPNASHAINGEFPEEINSRILAFVSKHAKD